MAVKIRLQRKGRKKRPFYYVVVADSRSPRDGRFIDRIGSYNPIPNIPFVDIDMEKAIHWLNNGAVPTKTVRNLLSREGILYKKHLLRGIELGILTEQEADLKFSDFIKQKAEKAENAQNKAKKKSEDSFKSKMEKEAEINKARAKKIAEKRQAEIAELTATEEDTSETGEVVEDAAVVEDTPAIEETPVEEKAETAAPKAETLEAEAKAPEAEAPKADAEEAKPEE